MSRLFAIATILTCLSISSYAQKSIINGYIVQLNGDTTKGYIDYKNWNKNPSAIAFYKQKPGNKEVFDTSNIKAFGVNNGKYADDYILQTIDIENSVQNFDRLNYDPKPIFEQRTVFLQKIVTGDLSLFKYTDSSDRQHYFIMKDNVYEELIYKKYFAASRLVAFNDNYKKQLVKKFLDCSSITATEVEESNFREPELIALILKYNKCKSPSTVNTVRNTQKIVFKFQIIGGVSYTHLKLSNSNSVGFKPSTDFTAGVGGLFIMPRSSEKLAIYADVIYKRFHFTQVHKTPVSPNQYTLDYFDYLGNYIKIDVLFRYILAQHKGKPFFNVGVSNAMSLSEIDKSYQTNVFYDTSFTRSNSSFSKSRKHEQGFLLGLGTNVNKFGFELRGELSNGFFPFVASKSSLATAYLLLHYQL